MSLKWFIRASAIRCCVALVIQSKCFRSSLCFSVALTSFLIFSILSAVSWLRSGLSGLSTNGERVRFDPTADARYVGITFTGLNQTGISTNSRERAQLNFYDASNTLVHSRTVRTCTTAFATGNATLYIDATSNFSYFDVSGVDRADGTDSSFRIGGIAFCSTGPASSCTTPATVGTVCP